MHISHRTTYINPTFRGKNNCPEKVVSSKTSNNNTLLYSTMIALGSFLPLQSNADRINPDAEFGTAAATVELKENGNNIIDMSDFEYSNNQAKKTAQPYLDGLKPFLGKKWSQATEDFANNLIFLHNVTQNYSYDSYNDELVKDYESKIIYGKNNRIVSTILTNSYGDTHTVSYKYNKDGSIDQALYDDKIVDYRKNGTKFMEQTVVPDVSVETIYYNKQGKKNLKQTKTKDEYTEIKYDENESILGYYHRDKISGILKIFKDNEPVLITNYNSKGKVIGYSDIIFDNPVQTYVIQGWMGKSTTINKNEKYSTLYKESPLDGKITKPVRQGTSGTCYAAGIINSLVNIDAGRVLLDNALPNDYDYTKCIVDFKGLNKKYSIDELTISHNMSRLGRKDADYAGMIKAFENFRQEDLSPEEKSKLPKEFFTSHDENDRRVDTGSPIEFFYALSGKIMEQSGDKITMQDLKKASNYLKSGKGVVNAGTIFYENKHDEIPDEDYLNGVFPKHNVSVYDIDLDKGYVTIYDSVYEKETRYPLNKFKKYFSKLFYAQLD